MSELTNNQTVEAVHEMLAELRQAAKDGQLIQNGYYATESEGRAAVADGETFKVQGSGDIAAYQYRRNTSTSSTLLSTYPAASSVERVSGALSNDEYGAGYSDPLPIPGGTSNAGGIVLLDWPQIAGRISTMYINSSAAGAVDVYVYSKSGDTFTLIRQTELQVPAGYSALPLSLDIGAGEYIAVRGFSGTLRYATATRADGNGWRSGTPGVSFTQAVVNTSTRIMVRFDVSQFTGQVSAVSGLRDDVSDLRKQVLTQISEQVINHAAPFEAASNSLAANRTYLFKAPVVNSGDAVFECRATSAGTVKLLLMTKISETRYLQRAAQLVNVVAGENQIPLAIKAKSGDYFALKSAVVGSRTEAGPGAAWDLTQNFIDNPAWDYGINVLAGLRIRSAVSPGAGGAAVRPSAVDLPWQYMLLVGLGHSLIEGSQTATSGTAPITTMQEFDTLGFPAYPNAPSVLLPATVANTQRVTPTLRGEWSGLGAAAALRKAIQRKNNLSYTDIKSTVVVANNGVGGEKIAGIVKGTAQYDACIAQAAALESVAGGTAGALAVLLGIGENEAAGDVEAYLQTLQQLVIDLDADLRAATGQVKSVPTVMYQMSTQRRAITLHQLTAARYSSLIAIACPAYILSYYDNIHIDSVSERILGAYFAEAIKTVSLDGGKWEPLWPVACDVSGNFVTLTFNKQGLVLDTTLIPAQTNSGFAVSGTTISSISVLNGCQVRLQCAAAPALGAVVSYGVAAVGKGPYTGRAGNLRDSRGDNLAFDSFPLHNWCVEFDWIV